MWRLFLVGVLIMALTSAGGAQVMYQTTEETASWRWDASEAGTTFIVAADNGEWEKGLAVLPEPLVTQLTPIDFHEDVAILASLGERPTGGYQILIERVTRSASVVSVEIRRGSPDPDGFVTMAFTYPYDLVTLPRDMFFPGDVVTFVDQTGQVLQKVELQINSGKITD